MTVRVISVHDGLALGEIGSLVAFAVLPLTRHSLLLMLAGWMTRDQRAVIEYLLTDETRCSPATFAGCSRAAAWRACDFLRAAQI